MPSEVCPPVKFTRTQTSIANHRTLGDGGKGGYTDPYLVAHDFEGESERLKVAREIHRLAGSDVASEARLRQHSDREVFQREVSLAHLHTASEDGIDAMLRGKEAT